MNGAAKVECRLRVVYGMSAWTLCGLDGRAVAYVPHQLRTAEGRLDRDEDAQAQHARLLCRRYNMASSLRTLLRDMRALAPFEPRMEPLTVRLRDIIDKL